MTGEAKDEHYDMCVDGGGNERGPMTGDAKDEHRKSCMKGKDSEDWGAYLKETAKANGKKPGNPAFVDHDAEEKIRELNNISHPGQTGWMVHFTEQTPPRKRYYHPKLQLTFHEDKPPRYKMTFKSAKQAARDDAEARAGRKKLKAGLKVN